jgi:hypothetical protein
MQKTNLSILVSYIYYYKVLYFICFLLWIYDAYILRWVTILIVSLSDYSIYKHIVYDFVDLPVYELWY